MVQSSCVLKSSREHRSDDVDNPDNLLYEYLVGIWLNDKINEKCPFFVCTHGLFYYKTNNYYNTLNGLYHTKQNITQSNKHFLIQALELQHFKDKKYTKSEYISWLKMSYEHPTKICILIEGVPNTKCLGDILVEKIYILL